MGRGPVRAGRIVGGGFAWYGNGTLHGFVAG